MEDIIRKITYNNFLFYSKNLFSYECLHVCGHIFRVLLKIKKIYSELFLSRKNLQSIFRVIDITKRMLL